MKIFVTIEITPEEWAQLRDGPIQYGLEALPEVARIWQDEILFSLVREMQSKTPELVPYFIKQLEEDGACSTFLLSYLKETE